MENFDEYLRYDDGKLFWIKKPARSVRAGSEAGCIRYEKGRGRASVTLNGVRKLRSHVVWYLHHGYFPKEIDHIDTNQLNDRIENLRECTQSQNRMNQGKVVSKSGYKGVHWAKGVWCARIKYKGKQTILGYDKDPVVCAKLYDKAAQEMFGEFANLNFKELS